MRRPAIFLLLFLVLPGEVVAGSDDETSPDEESGPLPGAVPPPPPLFVAGESSVPFVDVLPHIPSLSAQTCDACHGPFVEDWRASGHGQAWSDALYQEALEAAQEPQYCLRCHLPLLNQRSNLVKGYNEAVLSRPRVEPNPRFDPTLRGEGVTCASCHVRQGEVYGPRTLLPGQAPHPVTHNPELSDPALCASCHQLAWPGTEEKPLYDTYREWQASAWATAGVRCQDCHMALEVGRITGSRLAAHPSHEITGASDDAMLARALTVLVGSVPPEIQRGTELAVEVKVLNTGAGHHVPTGNPHSWIEVRIRCEGQDGMGDNQLSWPLRRDVSLEQDHEEGEDTRLPSGGESAFAYTFTPDKKLSAPAVLQLVVELVYHRLPAGLAEQYGKSEEEVSRVFHEQVVDIPLM